MGLKLYIGCAMPPFHPQHLEVLGDVDEWTWVDKYVSHPKIKQWDGMVLDKVEDNTVEQIYSSHTLEHFEHTKVLDVLKVWNSKMKQGGTLTLNVPNILWALNRLRHKETGGLLNGYYTEYDGEHGIMSIIYGSQSHDGEYHKSAYTPKYLECLLTEAGFTNIQIETKEDAHDMGVILAICQK